MKFYDPRTKLFVADAQENPLAGTLPTHTQVLQAFSPMILSASGWRKVFASSGDEEDATEGISRADAVLAAYTALSLARHLGIEQASQQFMEACGHGARLEACPVQKLHYTVLVGIDARPTGPAFADVVCRILLSLGVSVRYLFIAAAPEIMADSAVAPAEADAFLYISASHNPVGHNGIKFGRDGGVYAGSVSAKLATTMRELAADALAPAYVQKLCTLLDTNAYEAVLQQMPRQKEQSLQRYRQFVLTTAAGSDAPGERDALVAHIRDYTKHHPIGIVAELNGSARGDSIDVDFLTSLGITVHAMNDTPRQIVHPIVPEGENLELCRTTLQALHASNPAFQIGYVPDNDGDRGNLVYIRQSNGSAHILQAQEVFATVVVIELADLRRKLGTDVRMAIAVNCPTSMRIESICKALGVEVHRAEVGEANVVELAQKLRAQGAIVRVLGEGSNGGNITDPAKVRDPMNTIMSLVKFLSSTGSDSIFATWLTACGQDTSQQPSIEALVESLPKYTTTGAFSPQGNMHVKSTDQGKLKSAYEQEFLSQWNEQQEYLKTTYGIYGWKEYQTEGTVCDQGMGPEHRKSAKGGLKIVFLDKDGNPTDYIWMRGSGTEPIFRVLADCKGNCPKRHDFLLQWHRKMIETADEAVAAMLEA